MSVVWITAEKVTEAVARTPAGAAAISRAEVWAAAGYVAVVGAMAWFGSDDPPKPHEDIDLPFEGRSSTIMCSAHPFWDCYTEGEGCLGRSV